MSLLDSVKRFLSIISDKEKIAPNASTATIVSSASTPNRNEQAVEASFYDYYDDTAKQKNGYLYLRKCAYEAEKNDNMDLALSLMQRSTEDLRKRNCRNADEFLPLVKLLARAGKIAEAEKEKEMVDGMRLQQSEIINAKLRRDLERDCKDFRTDLVIVSVGRYVCPDCAKYQGRVFSRSGKSTVFPKFPSDFSGFSCSAHNCGLSTWAYIDGVTNPDLEHTLCEHPLSNPAYGKNIITFSNRPFIDDRTEEAKQIAAEAIQKADEKRAKEEYSYQHMIEHEAILGQEARDFKWIQENIPDKCPKSIAGYRRMKTSNSKNYQLLKELAVELGKDIL